MAESNLKRRVWILLIILALAVAWQRLSWDGEELSWRPFGQPRHSFAHVPCGIPIHITMGRVDPRFGFDEATVSRAMKEAAALWQDAAAADMFVWSDHPKAMVVSMQFDERQHNVNQQRSLRGGIDRDRSQLQSRDTALKQWGERIEAARRAHDRLAEAFAQRARAHEADVASWNTGSPQARTAARRQDIERESAMIQSMGIELQRSQDELNRDIATYNRQAREQQQHADQFRGRVAQYNTLSSPQPIESGRYSYDRERGRRIEVFRAGDYNDLVWILAHELGHAIGLDHLNRTGAVMNELLHDGEIAQRGAAAGPVELSRVDRRAVVAFCGERLHRR
ncbi:MAG: matrixin family metalloprotease [Pseudomonadota bacterium]|nr:matrixin family metalloprotease [Pseudomonadota bacterium]